MSGRVLIYGGRGALGAACVDLFKAQKWWVVCVDLAETDQADVNIVVARDGSWAEQEASIVSRLAQELQGEKLDAVICVAGGWAGGNAANALAESSELMWKQSVWSSAISAVVAANYLKPGGFLSLTGAKAALDATPGMIGYGMAKAAVHQLTKSLAGEGSGMPENALVVSILPVILDTPNNRKFMPDADFSTWTPLSFIAELFWKWANGNERPSNGSLVGVVTENFATKLSFE